MDSSQLPILFLEYRIFLVEKFLSGPQQGQETRTEKGVVKSMTPSYALVLAKKKHGIIRKSKFREAFYEAVLVEKEVENAGAS